MQFTLNQGNRRGAIHKKNGIDNQDAVCSMIKNDRCAICLADGAGSKEMSGYGAEHITNQMCRYLTKHFDDLSGADYPTLNITVMSLINSELEVLSERYGKNRNQFASTLLFAVTDGAEYIVGHLGDGCIISMNEIAWNVLSFPQNGKESNSTYLTSMMDAGKHLRIQSGKCDGISGFLLASDGIMPEVFGDSFSFSKRHSLVDTFIEKMRLETSDDASYIACCWEK